MNSSKRGTAEAVLLPFIAFQRTDVRFSAQTYKAGSHD